MIGRLVEDAYVAGRFVWFYAKAPGKIPHLGFGERDQLTVRARARWAWDKTMGRL